MPKKLNDRPRWQRITIWTLLAVFVVVWPIFTNWAFDKADAQAAESGHGHTAARECVSPDQTPCKSWEKKKARQFKNGKLGDSRKGVLTRHTKKLIDRWYNHHPKAKAAAMAEDGYKPRLTADGRVVARDGDWCSWCDFEFDAATCMVHIVVHPGACVESTDQIRRFQNNVTRVVVGCGSSSYVAYVAGAGPEAVIGTGLITCTWGKVVDAWDKRVACQPHQPLPARHDRTSHPRQTTVSGADTRRDRQLAPPSTRAFHPQKPRRRA